MSGVLWEGPVRGIIHRYSVHSSHCLTSSGQPNMEKGRSPEENQVSNTSSSG